MLLVRCLGVGGVINASSFICDYATRYPEAMALRKVNAGSVAEQLIELFSRVGILREILSDQGTNFMSQLLKSSTTC